MATAVRVWVAVVVLACALPVPIAGARELTEEEIRGWIDHIASLQRRRRQEPRDPRLLLQLAEAFGRIGDLWRARRMADRAERAGADPIATNLVRADALRRWRHNADAIPLYLEVVAAAPNQTYALVQLWRIAVEEVVSGGEVSARLRDVIARLRAAGMYVPDVYAPDPRAAEEAGRLVREAMELLGRQRASEAITRAEQAISQDPGLAVAFELLWRAYDLLGEHDRALGACAVVLEIDPDGPSAQEARDFTITYYRNLIQN